jgi:hypothetical protein
MPDLTRTCAVEGCESPCHTRKNPHCRNHYVRLQRNGTLEPKKRPRCSIQTCKHAASVNENGYCKSHQARHEALGHALARKNLKGANSAIWKGDNIRYVAAHCRVRAIKGKASQYECRDCWRPAHDWAYDQQDPHAKIDSVTGYIFSTDPEHYVALCKRCHWTLDHERVSRGKVLTQNPNLRRG